jgi:hypothetical protein
MFQKTIQLPSSAQKSVTSKQQNMKNMVLILACKEAKKKKIEASLIGSLWTHLQACN